MKTQKFKNQLIVLLMFLSSYSCSNYDEFQSNKLNTEVNQHTLETCVQKLNLLGLQVSVQNSNGEIWNGAAGHIDIKRTEELTPNHVLRIGSITKTFVATRVLLLIEQNQLSLSDTIDKWFPDIPNSSKITVLMLLNQTSGIENFWKNSGSLMTTMLGKKWDTNKLVKLIAKLTPYAEPGTTFYYSNSNYVLLAAIVEEITGNPISSEIQNTILTPLGMGSTYFLPCDTTPEKLIVGFDSEYIKVPGYYKMKPDNKTWALYAQGAGAMASTTSDLIIFMDALTRGKIITAETLKLMQTFDSDLQIMNDAIPNQVSYGLGFARFEIGDDVLWGHMGGLMGFESIVLHCFEKNYSISVIGNLSVCHVTEVVKEFQKTL